MKTMNPHALLGWQRGCIIHWQPNVKSIALTSDNKIAHFRNDFVVIAGADIRIKEYVFHFDDISLYDPYSFDEILSRHTAETFLNSIHCELHRILGCHPQTFNGIKGFVFRVYAPDAMYVVLRLQQKKRLEFPMRNLFGSGIYEVFLGVFKGSLEGLEYEFAIGTKKGDEVIKVDPFAFYSSLRPAMFSKIISRNEWSKRKPVLFQKSKNIVSIYEVHFSSWSRKKDGSFLNYREISRTLPNYVKKMGFTHVEFMPITEYPYDESWGYQVTGYFSPTSRYGTHGDIKYLIKAFHDIGIGVILDFVGGHFPTDEKGLCQFDGSHVFEDDHPTRGYQPCWTTLVFDFEKIFVMSFLISSIVYFIEEFGIDGIRFDAVSSLLYLDFEKEDHQWGKNHVGTNIHIGGYSFLKECTRILREKYKDIILIAEEATSFDGVTLKNCHDESLGFTHTTALGWSHDTVSFFSMSDEEKKKQGHLVSFYPHYMSNEEHLLYFSHDQIVENNGSLFQMMKGNDDERWLQVRLFLSYMMTLPGAKLLFNGCESKQTEKWSLHSNMLHISKRVESSSLQQLMKDLNKLYVKYPAFHSSSDFGSFSWLEWDVSKNGCLAFFRYDEKNKFLVIHNFMSTEVSCEYMLGSKSPVFLLSSYECISMRNENRYDTSFTENGLFSILMPPFTCCVFKIYEEL